MNKRKIKLLLLSITGLIATFLPYGLVCKMYSLKTDKNCFLWKMFDVDLEQYQEDVIVDVINAINAIFIVTMAVLVVLLVILYAISEKKFLEPIIQWYAIIAIVVSLFFGYNYTKEGCYKYINIGFILVFLCNVLIVLAFTEFKKRNWLILATALILSLPSMLIYYVVDIEGGVDDIPCSSQTYIRSFVSGLVYEHNTWQTAIPTLVMILAILLMVIAVLGEFKYKNIFVLGSIISIMVTFIYEMRLVKRNELSVDLTYTYVISIVLLVLYLVIDKKEKVRQKNMVSGI